MRIGGIIFQLAINPVGVKRRNHALARAKTGHPRPNGLNHAGHIGTGGERHGHAVPHSAFDNDLIPVVKSDRIHPHQDFILAGLRDFCFGEFEILTSGFV